MSMQLPSGGIQPRVTVPRMIQDYYWEAEVVSTPDGQRFLHLYFEGSHGSMDVQLNENAAQALHDRLANLLATQKTGLHLPPGLVAP